MILETNFVVLVGEKTTTETIYHTPKSSEKSHTGGVDQDLNLEEKKKR